MALSLAFSFLKKPADVIRHRFGGEPGLSSRAVDFSPPPAAIRSFGPLTLHKKKYFDKKYIERLDNHKDDNFNIFGDTMRILAFSLFFMGTSFSVASASDTPFELNERNARGRVAHIFNAFPNVISPKNSYDATYVPTYYTDDFRLIINGEVKAEGHVGLHQHFQNFRSENCTIIFSPFNFFEFAQDLCHVHLKYSLTKSFEGNVVQVLKVDNHLTLSNDGKIAEINETVNAGPIITTTYDPKNDTTTITYRDEQGKILYTECTRTRSAPHGGFVCFNINMPPLPGSLNKKDHPRT